MLLLSLSFDIVSVVINFHFFCKKLSILCTWWLNGGVENTRTAQSLRVFLLANRKLINHAQLMKIPYTAIIAASMMLPLSAQTAEPGAAPVQQAPAPAASPAQAVAALKDAMTRLGDTLDACTPENAGQSAATVADCLNTISQLRAMILLNGLQGARCLQNPEQTAAAVNAYMNTISQARNSVLAGTFDQMELQKELDAHKEALEQLAERLEKSGNAFHERAGKDTSGRMKAVLSPDALHKAMSGETVSDAPAAHDGFAKYEAAYMANFALFKECVEAFKTVKDKATADAAANKITNASSKMLEYKEQLREMPVEVMHKLNEGLKTPENQAVGQDFSKAVDNLQKEDYYGSSSLKVAFGLLIDTLRKD